MSIYVGFALVGVGFLFLALICGEAAGGGIHDGLGAAIIVFILIASGVFNFIRGIDEL